MRKLLGYLLGYIGVITVVAGGVGITLGVWLRESEWIAAALPLLALGALVVAGSRHVLLAKRELL